MIHTVDGLRLGQMVCSIKGRDDGNFYLIKELTGDRFLQLIDGIKHDLVRPKKKNVKHVRVIMLVSTEIEEAFAAGKLVTDSQVVIAIRKLQNVLEEGDRFHG